MKTLALMIALAAAAGAGAADDPGEVSPAVPVAAAVSEAQYAQEQPVVAGSVAPAVREVGEALPGEAGKAAEPAAVCGVGKAEKSSAQPAAVVKEPRSDSRCDLPGLYCGRFLSGPWSVARRLEAARVRGDREEAERLTELLDELVGEALEVEGVEP